MHTTSLQSRRLRGLLAALPLLIALCLAATAGQAAVWQTMSLTPGEDKPLAVYDDAPAPPVLPVSPAPAAKPNEGVEMINNLDAAIRRSTIARLTKLEPGNPEVVPNLLDILGVLPTKDKLEALWVLSSLITTREQLDKALPALVAAAGDENSIVRARVLLVVFEARKKIPDNDAQLIATLATALETAPPAQAQGLAPLLAIFGAKAAAAAPTLALLLTSPDPRTKLYAALALAAIAPDQAPNLISVLANAVNSTSVELDDRFAAIKALAKLGPSAKSCLPALFLVAKEGHYILASAALDAAGSIASDGIDNPPMLVPALIEGLAAPNELTRAAAARALGRAGAATPGLEQGLAALEQCLAPEAVSSQQAGSQLPKFAAWALVKLDPARLEKLSPEGKKDVEDVEKMMGGAK